MTKKVYLILFLFLGLLNSSCVPILFGQTYEIPHHMLETNEEYQVMWNQSDIHVTDENIISSPGKIIIEGVKKGELLPNIFGLDSMTGNIIWQIQGGSNGNY